MQMLGTDPLEVVDSIRHAGNGNARDLAINMMKQAWHAGANAARNYVLCVARHWQASDCNEVRRCGIDLETDVMELDLERLRNGGAPGLPGRYQ